MCRLEARSGHLDGTVSLVFPLPHVWAFALSSAVNETVSVLAWTSSFFFNQTSRWEFHILTSLSILGLGPLRSQRDCKASHSRLASFRAWVATCREKQTPPSAGWRGTKSRLPSPGLGRLRCCLGKGHELARGWPGLASGRPSLISVTAPASATRLRWPGPTRPG